jgi:membrane protein YqaA with SNARE-associated domain
MRWFAARFVTFLASPVGVIVLAALDSTIFVSLPFGIDAAVIILAARLQTLWWVAPILATFGSVAGAGLTFWMGVKAGEQGLERYVTAKRLARVRARIQRSGAVALAVLDLIPPPFPFTPFVLAAGALGVNASTFFVTLIVCRLLRFGLEAALAVVYGPHILSWLESDLFHDIVIGCILLAVVLSVLSVIALVRTSGRPRRRARPGSAPRT